MNKIAVVLIPVLALTVGGPAAAALLLAAVVGPAVEVELRTLHCAGALPATGTWRPPHTQPYTVTSAFGTRFHPIHGEDRLHAGVDLAATPTPSPSPVVAAAAGTVTTSGYTDTGGHTLALAHPGGVTTRYLHLARRDAQVGQAVRAGDRLGVEGSTGASTGNHLHFEVHVDGRPVDPEEFMADQGAPLNGLAVAPAAGPPPDLPVDVAEGGIGFDLPPPGTPRQASLTNPPQPIPADVKALYVAAADRYRIPWTLLAGLGMAETAHGANTGTSSAGAQGLMQFLPATFAVMGVDGDGDGIADIGNDADSVHSAANYLTSSGVTQGPDGVREALFAYNHAHWYVNDVLFYAHAYGGGLVLGDPTDCGPGTGPGDPELPPITDERVAAVLSFAADQVGDTYVMGANGPDAWDCSSLTQNAYAQVGISTPRTAQAQRDWLALGNGYRVPPGQERPGDLIFYDSYLGPERIGHVALVWDPTTQTTLEAASPRSGVGHFDYADDITERNIFEIWRVGSIADHPTRQP